MTTPIPVAFVIDALDRGGAERVAVSLANELNPDRFRAHMITTRKPGSLAADLGQHVCFHSLDRNSRWDVGALQRFARFIKKHDVRIVHAHNHTSAYFVHLARRLSGQRWIEVMHDHYGPIKDTTWLQLFDRLFVRHVDHYFGVSEHLVQYAIEDIGLPPMRCEFLVNGVSTRQMPRQAARDRFTVVQVGRLVPVKNHLMAINVAALVRQQIPTLRWLFVGREDADNAAYIESCREAVRAAGLEGTVFFSGEQSDIPALLQQADVGVLTSHSEGLPMALLEYMASGLPVVVTDVGACKRVVEESGGGSVVAPGDVVAFAEALIELGSKPERAISFGQRNRASVEQHYSIQAMAQRVMAVYDRLLDGS